MKQSILTTMLASTMCFSVNQMVVAQDNMKEQPTQAVASGQYYYPVVQESLPEPKRWHMDFDAGYTTFSAWSVSGAGKELKGDYAVGMKLAATYSFWDGMLSVGGGTGFRMYQMSWSDKSTLSTKDPIIKNYDIPVFVRVLAKSPFSDKVEGYIQLDTGYQFGTDELKSSLFIEGQVGIYWDRAKLGIGAMMFHPKSTNYIPEAENNGTEGCIGLFLGFRLF